ncbi:MAG: 3'-5' exonuclease [Gammaproteobacteria bacterium]|nr:3'-5' exonuclease [Gammaproteobacteria bacterium]MDH5736089.1 3'-5' exonuclease [Gammaproteobacteria bacterium]
MVDTVSADTVIVLDFETTGLSPDYGDRAIEIGAVKLVDGVQVDRFQKLMYPGKRINAFIENYTGITNSMLKQSPPCKEVMTEFADFINGFNLVAHNASFDSRFLAAELNRVKRNQYGPFACSMLIARRIYPDAPNHKLGTLVKYNNLPSDGTFHRALADAEMAAHLWLRMVNDIKDSYEFKIIPFKVMQKLSRTAKNTVSSFLVREATLYR